MLDTPSLLPLPDRRGVILGLYWGYIGLYWDYIGLYWGYIGVILGLYWGYSRFILGFISGFYCLSSFCPASAPMPLDDSLALGLWALGLGDFGHQDGANGALFVLETGCKNPQTQAPS